MSAIELLGELARRGIEVRFRPPDDVTLRSKSDLEPDFLARLRQHKSEIIAILAERPAACAPSCYPLQGGVWIHHPSDGCKTPIRAAADQAVPKRWWEPGRPCWHCRGAGSCSCITCESSDQAGPCIVCKGSKRIPEQVQ